MDMKDSVCIVTGAGTGTGAACAVGLARKGAHVVINYRRSEAEAMEVKAQCEAAGAQALVIKGDVAQDADCQEIVRATLAYWGRIDGLVNSAGVTKFVSATRLDGLSAQDWQDIYAVNVIGAYQMIRACVPAMRKQGRASVVNISSMSGLNGLGSSIAYAASKGALNTMTLSLARALAPEIRVNAVCPGMIETRWHRARFDEEGYARFKADYESRVPLAKAATAEDVAHSVVWLMEGADQVTGEMIKVDGGFHLGKSGR